MTTSARILSLSLLAMLSSHAVAQQPGGIIAQADTALRVQVTTAGARPLAPKRRLNPHMVELGRMLFYDRLLSGNRDISCATCHHDDLVTGDALSLAIGTRGVGLGLDRRKAVDRKFTRRNSPEIFNRGSAHWRTQFWDSRVARVPEGFLTPANGQLPAAFSHVLQVQAMFPVTSRDEMRGKSGDRDIFGNVNEIGLINDRNFTAIWDALMARLMSPQGARSAKTLSYRELFARAYPHHDPRTFGFEHAAIAIATFEEDAYTLTDSPWDRYLRGDDTALSPAARRGASLFYGKARCSTCHTGTLMTDQRHHNMLVPHIGSETLTGSKDDTGRHDETKRPFDRYAFRTPPLRNVAATGPWMHNGAYATLAGAVLHHLDPVNAFLHYDRRQLFQRDLATQVRNTPADLERRLPTVSQLLPRVTPLSSTEIADLLHFLHALTSPSLKTLPAKVPHHVPSGLPVDGREQFASPLPLRHPVTRASQPFRSRLPGVRLYNDYDLFSVE